MQVVKNGMPPERGQRPLIVWQRGAPSTSSASTVLVPGHAGNSAKALMRSRARLASFSHAPTLHLEHDPPPPDQNGHRSPSLTIAPLDTPLLSREALLGEESIPGTYRMTRTLTGVKCDYGYVFKAAEGSGLTAIRPSVELVPSRRVWMMVRS